jgi:hypothetical protein
VAIAPRDTVLSFLGLSVMERFGVPQMVIIDKKGVIRRQSEPQGTAELQMPDKLIPMIKGFQAEGGSATAAEKSPAPKAGASTKSDPATPPKKTS